MTVIIAAFALFVFGAVLISIAMDRVLRVPSDLPYWRCTLGLALALAGFAAMALCFALLSEAELNNFAAVVLAFGWLTVGTSAALGIVKWWRERQR